MPQLETDCYNWPGGRGFNLCHCDPHCYKKMIELYYFVINLITTLK